MKKTAVLIMLLLFNFFPSLPSAAGKFTVTADIDGTVYSEEFAYARLPLAERIKGRSYADAYEESVSQGNSRTQALNSVADGLGDFVLSLFQRAEILPSEGKITFDGDFCYEEGKDGRKLDDKVYDDIKRCLGSKNIVLNLDFENVKSSYDIEKLKTFTVERARFTTYYASSTDNRKHNIKLATERINGSVVEDEEIFSFNAAVGKRTAESGFREAGVIMDGEFTSGIGGGVCQVSTTLYNAALEAGLEPVSVTRHTLGVSYVEPSFDAMVSDYTDFTFINRTGAPVYIGGEADGEKVTFVFYGVHNPFRIRRVSRVVRELPCGEKIVEDSTIDVPEQIISYGKNGLISEGILEYYFDNRLIKSVKIRRDVYRAVPMVKKVNPLYFPGEERSADTCRAVSGYN